MDLEGGESLRSANLTLILKSLKGPDIAKCLGWGFCFAVFLTASVSLKPAPTQLQWLFSYMLTASEHRQFQMQYCLRCPSYSQQTCPFMLHWKVVSWTTGSALRNTDVEILLLWKDSWNKLIFLPLQMQFCCQVLNCFSSSQDSNLLIKNLHILTMKNELSWAPRGIPDCNTDSINANLHILFAACLVREQSRMKRASLKYCRKTEANFPSSVLNCCKVLLSEGCGQYTAAQPEVVGALLLQTVAT